MITCSLGAVVLREKYRQDHVQARPRGHSFVTFIRVFVVVVVVVVVVCSATYRPVLPGKVQHIYNPRRQMALLTVIHITRN